MTIENNYKENDEIIYDLDDPTTAFIIGLICIGIIFLFIYVTKWSIG